MFRRFTSRQLGLSRPLLFIVITIIIIIIIITIVIIIIIISIIIEMSSGRNDIIILRKGSLARLDSNLRHQFA